MNLLLPVSRASLLHPLLDLMSDAVLLLDDAGRISFANAESLRVLGCEAGWRVEQLESVLGQPALRWMRSALAGRANKTATQALTLIDGRTAEAALQRLEPRLWVLRLQCEPVLADAPAAPLQATARPASAEQLRLLWDLPIPALVEGPDSRVLDVNPAFAEYTGLARDALIGIDPVGLFHEGDRGGQPAKHERHRDAHGLRDTTPVPEQRLIDAGGRERWSRVSRRALLDDAGRSLVLVTLQDCTAEHVARERADRSARELDDWFNLSPVGMVLFEDSGLLVRTNRAFDALVDAVPALLSEASPELQQLLAFASGRPLPQLQQAGSTLECQSWLPWRDGAPRRLRSVVRCYETPGGQRRYMAVVEDRSMEEERDLAQMQIGVMMDTAGVGLATFQESTGWLRQRASSAGVEAVPSAALQAVGREIVVAKSLPEFEKVQHALGHTLRAEARYAIRHPDLGLRWLLTRVEPATLASGERATTVVTLDITEQHETQERSEQLLHELTTILESTSAGIAYVRANLLVRCNQRFERMFGLADGHATGRDLDQIFAPWPQAKKVLRRAAAALAESASFETDFGFEDPVLPGAGTLWYALSVRRTSPSNEPLEAIAQISDIARQKAQQSELEVLARDRELMFSLSGIGIAFVRDGKIQRANEAFATLTGHPVERISALPFEALFADRAEFKRVWARANEQLHRRGRWSGECRLRRRDGQLVWVQVSKRLVVEGDPTGGIVASYVNVDARHRAEQAVALQADRTRAILDSVLVGIVTVNAKGIDWMNRSARRMFGGDLADFVGHPISTVATPDPGHPFRQTQYLNELFEGQAETFECRVKARDGREFWVVGNVVATGVERVGRQLTYALLDIERRRQAEARSAETQASLQRLIEMAPLAIALRDARTLRVLQINQTAADMLGRPTAELVGRAPEEIYPPDEAETMRADMLAALGADSVTKREYRVAMDGQQRLWEARYLPLGPVGEAPDQLLLVSTDVTEQRAAQEARLEAAIEHREMLVKEVHHRIKNNLQGVAGLLQQIAARKPEVQAVISEVVGQVQAIAQVYGLQVGSGGPLVLRSVVEAISGSVQRIFGCTIALSIRCTAEHEWALPEAESIPIALTINELLTNAIKHCGGDSHAVSCELECSVDGIRLVIGNVGALGANFNLAGIPGGVSGLGLVRALMPRRSATLTLEQSGPRVLATLVLVPPGIKPLEVLSDK